MEAVRAIAKRVVIVLVDPVSSGSVGGLGAIVGDDEEEDEAIIKGFLGFLRER